MKVVGNWVLLVGLAFLQVFLVSSSNVLKEPLSNHTAISKSETPKTPVSIDPQPTPTGQNITTVPPITTTSPPKTTTTTPITTTSTVPTTNGTTITPPTTTSTPSTTPGTTPAPTTKPTAAPTQKPGPDNHFDPPSFIGGMILTMGLMAIAFVSWKFYKARTERNYHTL